MRRTTCSACGEARLETFLDLGLSPVADAYTATPDEPVDRHPLELAVCEKCRLVQLLEVLPGEVLFGTGYSFYGSASPPLSAYHAQYADALRRRCPAHVKRGVVEIGSNDGDLLRHFLDVPHIGVDPAQGPAGAAIERGCNIDIEPFGAAVAGALADQWNVKPGVVIANHVLAHVEDVADFLAGMATLMDDRAIAMIEVQYLPDMLVNNAFDLAYHEHRNHFSLTSLASAAARVGLHVNEAQLTSRQGGSLRATLSRATGGSHRVKQLLESERWLQEWGPYAGFQGRADRIVTRLCELLMDEVLAGRTVAGYGAPAKATTLLSFAGLNARHLSHVVDSTPAKQGRYIPGTGLRIDAPDAWDKPVDTFLLLAWNYQREIMRKPGASDKRWIVPIPAPVLL